MTKGPKLIPVNTRSIYRKRGLIEHLYSDADFFCCSETWLDNRMPDDFIVLLMAEIIRCDRWNDCLDYNVHITGGGVCIFFAKKWFEFTTQVNEGTLKTKDYEIVSIEIKKTTFRKMFIPCLYRTPKGVLHRVLVQYSTYIFQHTEHTEHKILYFWYIGF